MWESQTLRLFTEIPTFRYHMAEWAEGQNKNGLQNLDQISTNTEVKGKYN